MAGKAVDVARVKSDARGVARLRGLPLTEHWIVAELPRFARASQHVMTSRDARRLDLRLGEEHVLDVVVTHALDKPVAHAELTVRSAQEFPTGAVTDDAGRVAVRGLGEGPYTVTVRANGFEPVTRRCEANALPCAIALERRGALAVRVLGAQGEAVSGARVLVTSALLWPARSAQTGADGRVRIANLAPGSYALKSVHDAFVSPIEIGVSVNDGEEKSIELRLEPGSLIQATVTDASDDAPVAGARATLVESGLSPFPIEAVTDARGLVNLGPIARGAATLSVMAEGFVAKSGIRIAEATSGEPVRVRLVRGGTLVGRVVDTRGRPIDGATLRVEGTDLESMPIDEDPERVFFRTAHFDATLAGPRPLLPAGELGVMPGPLPSVPRPGFGNGVAGGSAQGFVSPASPRGWTTAQPWVSGRDGMFRATPVPPGRVRVVARHPEYVEVASEFVSLSASRDAELTVVMSRGGSIEGNVVDGRGRPVAEAQIVALDARGTELRMTQSSTTGAFALSSLPAVCTLVVSRKGDNDDDAAVRLDVDVSESQTKRVQVALEERRDALPVVVVDASGEPVVDAQVTALSMQPRERYRRTTFTRARGDAELAHARGLALRVEVTAPGFVPYVDAMAELSPSQTQTPVQPYRVVLRRGRGLRGRVKLGRREPAIGAEVTLFTQTRVAHTLTDRDGEFAFRDALEPGPARLRVRAQGRATVRESLVIDSTPAMSPPSRSFAADALNVADIELQEEAVFEGVVTDSKGAPVAGARIEKDVVCTYIPRAGPGLSVAMTDANGRFRLGQLPERDVVLEAYAPERGYARSEPVRATAGRTTRGVRLVLQRPNAGASLRDGLLASGVAVTLGEQGGGAVVVVAASEGSEAERGGVWPGDRIVAIDGQRATSLARARELLTGPISDDVVVSVQRRGQPLFLRIRREPITR